MKRRLLNAVLASVVALAASGEASAQISNTALPIEKQANGVIVNLAGGVLKLEVDADDIIRVAYAPDRAFFDHKSFATGIKTVSPAHWDVTNDANSVVLTTAAIKTIVDAQSGAVHFEDLSGKTILAEAPHGRTLEPAAVQGEQTHHARQQWLPNADESLYGLGQHQYGLVNIKGQDIELWQHNTEIAVPFLVSSKGYGIFWDNPSYTKFGNPRGYEAIPTDHLFDMNGKPGGFTAAPCSD